MKKKALLKKGEKNTVPLNVTLYIGNKKNKMTIHKIPHVTNIFKIAINTYNLHYYYLHFMHAFALQR